MGSELHNAFATAAMSGRLDGLSRPAFHVLATMTVIARDRTQPHVYFGGWAYLAAVALHRTPPYVAADERAVARAIHELTDAGLIKSRGRVRGQQSNAVYEVTL